jgi:rSAM/selenodomain-associated transferase 2
VSLTVIVPALDEAANLERLLPLVVARCPGAEVIVVDGGSRDGTPEVARRVPGVVVLSSVRGRARQMNHGAAQAGGRTLLFLHADTRLPEDAPEAIRRALEDPRVVAGRFDVRFDSARPVFRMIAFFMNLRSRLSWICTGDQGIFVRREVFEALGGYPDIPLMEDIELSRRLKRAGRISCLRLWVVTSARKWEREGPWRTIALMWGLRFLHALGVGPERLHRLYYHRPSADAADGLSPLGRDSS